LSAGTSLPAGEEGQDRCLARSKAEDLLRAVVPPRESGLRRREVEACSLGKQVELTEQGLGPDPGRDGVRLPQRHGRLGT